jgi:uridine kinase
MFSLKPVQERLQEITDRPPVIALEGMLGSGKSTAAEHITTELSRHPVIFGMDAFICISRHRMDEMLAAGPIVLEDWYSLDKVREAVIRARDREKFVLPGLYNLSDGNFTRNLEIDASRADLIIVEGLFSMHERFRDLVDLSIWIEIDPDIAKARAEQRDYTVRNLTPEQWQKKLLIYWEGYRPWMAEFKQSADYIYQSAQDVLLPQEVNET